MDTMQFNFYQKAIPVKSYFIFACQRESGLEIKMIFIKFVIISCFTGPVSSKVVLNKLINSNDKLLARQINQLINNASDNIIGIINNGVNYRAMDISEEILNNFLWQKSILSGKFENVKLNLDILLYFTSGIDRVSENTNLYETIK